MRQPLAGQDECAVVVQVETGATSNGQTVIAGCSATSAQCLKAGDIVEIPSTTSGTTSGTTGGAQNRSVLGGLTGGPSGPPPGAP